jgi:hypothetical protein
LAKTFIEEVDDVLSYITRPKQFNVSLGRMSIGVLPSFFIAVKALWVVNCEQIVKIGKEGIFLDKSVEFFCGLCYNNGCDTLFLAYQCFFVAFLQFVSSLSK